MKVYGVNDHVSLSRKTGQLKKKRFHYCSSSLSQCDILKK